ncbi:hypothetical protein EfmJHP36_18610 [Enterococcus faecium]|nr:hypothetical protein EfmJHP36_18610 [Enterococcus faecium]
MEIPRDRNGEFKQQTLPAYKRTNDTLETTIIHLFDLAEEDSSFDIFVAVASSVCWLSVVCPT